MKENARIAREEKSPICQDTGLAVLFIELGQDVHIAGGDFQEAVNAGVSGRVMEKAICENRPAILFPGPTRRTTTRP